MKQLLLFIVLLLIGGGLQATPTKLVVRAKAKDAKFIGSSIGGAYVIVRNKQTGEILAQGRTTGSTGNTGLIMKQPKERYTRLADENTSKFVATLDIDNPVFVTVEVLAPVNKKEASVAVSTELWMIPGKHIEGDGIIVEIPGFVVEVLRPRTHQFISLKDLKENRLEIQANIVMMCGCTISDGGLWDANKIEVKGLLSKNGEPAVEIPLTLVEPNLFKAAATVTAAGNYELIVYAYHAESGNTGLDKVNYVITN